MNLPDLINGLFETFGGLAIYGHVAALHKDKQVKGVSTTATGFFTAWGVWNLFYYPHLGQWLSFAGGLVIVSGNLVWITLMLYYRWRPHGIPTDASRRL